MKPDHDPETTPLNGMGEFDRFLAILRGPGRSDARELLKFEEIQSTLDSIRAIGIAHAAACVEERNRLGLQETRPHGGTARPPGLASSRIRDLQDRLNKARADEPLLSATNLWLQVFGLLATLVFIAVPFLLIARWGWDTSSLGQAANFSQFYSGLVTVVAIYVGWAYFLHLFDRRRRRDWCLKRLTDCRNFIQLIDSHLLSKCLSPHWEHPPCPTDAGGTAGDESDKVFQVPRIAIQYLHLASQEVRLCARIAAVYAQWLSDDKDVVNSAESLMRMALDIERNSLIKAEMIRRSAVEVGRAQGRGA